MRSDIWEGIKHYQVEYKQKHGERITLKTLVNEAIFDLILRRRMEEKTGIITQFADTVYDPNTRETRRKDELK